MEATKAKVLKAQESGDLEALEAALVEAQANGADPEQIDGYLNEVRTLRAGGATNTSASADGAGAGNADGTGAGGAADIMRNQAEAHKQRGNDILKGSSGAPSRTQAKEALEAFTAGLATGCEDPRLVAQLYSNRAHVRMLLRQFVEAVDDCRKAIDSDPSFLKAYWRGAKASLHLGLARNAVEFCEQGLAKEPGNAELSQLRVTCTEKLAEQQRQRAATDAAAAELGDSSNFNADEAMALQEKLNDLRENLVGIQNSIDMKQRDLKFAQMTNEALVEVPADQRLYNAVGRCFVLSDKAAIEERLASRLADCKEELPKLEKTKTELEKRKDSTEKELGEMLRAFKRQAG